MYDTDGAGSGAFDQEERDEPGDASESAGASSDPTDEAAETADGESGAATATSEAERALGELRDKYLRLAAEYDNYRKRATRERQEAGSRAQGELVKRIVDSLDDLQRVAHVDPDSADVRTVIDGVALVEGKLVKALSAAGLEVINPVDQPFNPELHEAVTTEPALSPEDDHMVARVFQLGYRFNGQLLRPARVVVKQWAG